MRNISETPDGWIVIKMETEESIWYKLFGSWNGDYLDGERWKMNSGISKIEEDEDHYYIFGFSGSCYQCNKYTYGKLNSYTFGIVSNTIKNSYKVNVKAEDITWEEFKKLNFD
jgi:hypothetical protein